MKTADCCNWQIVVDPEGKLDQITVFWLDFGNFKGSVTIICYGCAWTAYFGGMPAESIREFFQAADTGYLCSKLGITPLLKQRAKDLAYLGRIIEVVKLELRKTDAR